jgi:lipoprotein-anchoring transpeptidase ErfK/SrfK
MMRKSVLLSICLALLLTLLAIPDTVAASGNGIVLDGKVVSGTLELKGVAQHPTFRKWQVDLLLDGDPARATFLAVGDKPQTEVASLAEVDTSRYPDGEHLLRLRVVHSNLNYDEYFTQVNFANGSTPQPITESQPTIESQPPVEENNPAPLPTSGLDLSNAPADGLRRITISLTDQTLTAWQGNVVVMHTQVSTGRRATPTVRGQFTIGTKIPSQRMRGPGYDLPNVPSVMYFYRNYAIHGAYWHNNFGQVMSYGCVNMRPDEAAALYEWASVGTRVTVHD